MQETTFTVSFFPTMTVQQFYLLGEPASSARDVNVEDTLVIDDVKDLIASHFAIVSPNGEPNLLSSKHFHVPSHLLLHVTVC